MIAAGAAGGAMVANGCTTLDFELRRNKYTPPKIKTINPIVLRTTINTIVSGFILLEEEAGFSSTGGALGGGVAGAVTGALGSGLRST